jgi:hypothetical protein
LTLMLPDIHGPALGFGVGVALAAEPPQAATRTSASNKSRAWRADGLILTTQLDAL